MDKQFFIDEVDKEICALNDDYKTCRKHNLGHPTVEKLDPAVFYGFLEKIGKSGSQNKFPRVMNNQQANNWINYLKECEN